MSESGSISRVVAIVAAVAAVSATSYVLYFDHQRRSNPTFRKDLKKRAKKEEKKVKLDKQMAQADKLQVIAKFLEEELRKDPIPTDVNEKQSAFNVNIELGDRLVAAPGSELEAAAKFYKALTVYPNPADLLGIYQKSLPENIYENLVLMIAALPPANISTFLGGAPSQSEVEAMEKANDIDE